MATPLILAPLDGDLDYVDGGAGGTASGSGALRYRDWGRSGVDAALIECASTNLIINPQVKNDTASISGVGGSTVSRDTTFTYTDPDTSTVYNTLKIENAGVNPSEGGDFNGYAASPPTTPRSFAFSCEIWAPNAIPFHMIDNVHINGYNLPPDIVETGVGNGIWQRPTGVVTTQNGDAIDDVRLRVMRSWLGSPGGMGAETIWATRAQCEEKAFVTTYIDGDQGTGYSWDGTPHAWISHRAVTTVSIPTALPASVACHYSEDFGVTWEFGYLESLGTLGSYASITHDGSNLVLASSRSLLIGPVMAFSDTLTAGEQDALEGDTSWSLGMLEPSGFDAEGHWAHAVARLAALSEDSYE